MKFKNHSNVSVHVSGYGWIEPGASLEVPKEDTKTIGSIKGLHFFEEQSAASPPKSAKKKSSSKAE